MTTTALPDSWQRAMERATADRLHALKLNQRAYAVRSTKLAPGTHHIVSLDDCSKIVSCDCPGWRGRQHPCKHSAAVAKRLMREGQKGPRRNDAGVIEGPQTTASIFRAEVAR